MTTASKRIILDGELAWITPLVLFGGTVIFAIFAFLIMEFTKETSSLIVISMICLWLSIYCYFGFKIVANRDYLVIERFGEFNRIVHSGPRILCFPGLIDEVVASGTLRTKDIELFADETPPYEVDFNDGSARVRSKAWYCVASEGCENIEEINQAIYDFTYTLKDESSVRERIEDVLESSFVPLLQKRTIGEALVEKDTIAEGAVTEEVRGALKVNGIHLINKRSFIITDIVLPEAIIKLRQKKLEGESEANKQEEQGAGYARAIAGIIKAAKIAGENVDWKTAQGIYAQQRGLETLANTGSNISFVSPDIRGVQKTMGIGDVNQRNQKRSQA